MSDNHGWEEVFRRYGVRRNCTLESTTDRNCSDIRRMLLQEVEVDELHLDKGMQLQIRDDMFFFYGKMIHYVAKHKLK